MQASHGQPMFPTLSPVKEHHGNTRLEGQNTRKAEHLDKALDGVEGKLREARRSSVKVNSVLGVGQ